MQLERLLSRADDEALGQLLGDTAIRLILALDQRLATPDALKKLVLKLYSHEELLRDKSKRAVLIDLLLPEQAQLLAKILGVHGDAYDGLKTLNIRKKSEKESALFDFFEAVIHEEIILETEPELKVAEAGYPLFDHQRLAARRVSQYIYSRYNRVVLHMPTGAGKTRTAMNIIAEHLRTHEPTLVIWLASTEELCEQAASEFEKAWLSLGNRDVDLFRFWGNRNLDLDSVYDGLLIGGLAKVYSATKNRIQFISALASRTSLVVIDEAHSAIAESYSLILDALVRMQRPNPALLGLTATPGRTWADISTDEQLSNFFSRQKVTLEVEGYDNPVDFLVDQQYLARVSYRSLLHKSGNVLSDADIRRIEEAFDIPSQVLQQLAEDQQRNLLIIDAIEDLARRHSRIIVFAATVEHSDILAAVLQMRGYDARSITSGTPTQTRQNTISWFKNPDDSIRILCNFGVLTTGFDAPKTSAALIARPTKSLVLYSQMVGRAIRGKKAGGNETAEIITVVDYGLPGFGDVAEAFNNWEDIWE